MKKHEVLMRADYVEILLNLTRHDSVIKAISWLRRQTRSDPISFELRMAAAIVRALRDGSYRPYGRRTMIVITNEHYR